VILSRKWCLKKFHVLQCDASKSRSSVKKQNIVIEIDIVLTNIREPFKKIETINSHATRGRWTPEVDREAAGQFQIGQEVYIFNENNYDLYEGVVQQIRGVVILIHYPKLHMAMVVLPEGESLQ
jgi:hypothetical protein